MAEYSPFSEEHLSGPRIESFIDRIDEPTWQEFCEAVEDVERQVIIRDPADVEDKEHIQLHAADLLIKFGIEYIGQRSKVLALAYPEGHEDSAIDETVILNTDHATFNGVDLRYANKQWQTMLRFDCRENTDGVTDGAYYVPPNKHHLMSLKINIGQDEKDENYYDDDDSVTQTLRKDFRSVSAYIYGKEFTTCSPSGQRMLLSDITDAINGELPREYRERDVVIACTKFYTAYDDEPDRDLRESFTDLSSNSVDDCRTLIGNIENFEYPELKTIQSDYPLSAQVLDLNDGSYCLALRNDRDRATYYILPQTISDIF